MRSFVEELKRRNVIRVGIAYLVIAWVLAQVAELALDSFEAPAWVMKTLLLMLALGFPLTVFFAWAFEMTPEGLKKEREVDRSQSITSHTGRKLDFVIIGVLVVAVGFLLFDKFQSPGSDELLASATPGMQEALPAQKSIAVLPFVDMSAAKDQEYFSDGIAEELLNVLVRIKSIKVASRTSSFAFKGKDIGIPQIAEELKVNHILEGSVRKAGDRIRVTAQLIDVKSDRHLWSETYDRELRDIFAIQDEIAAEIVEALQVALGTGEQASLSHPHQATENLEAYELYLRGRSLWQRRGEENIKRSINLFEQATQLDPQFARAWSALAAAHLTLPVYSETEPVDFHWGKANSYAKKALALDDSIAETYAVLGDLARDRKQWQESESHYLRAIELEPGSATAHLWYGEFLADVGRYQDTLVHYKKAVELDPLSPGANSGLGESYRMMGDYEQAIKYTHIAVDLGHIYSLYVLARSYLATNDYARSAEYMTKFEDTLVNSGADRIGKQIIEAIKDPAQRPAVLNRLGQLKSVSDDIRVFGFVVFDDIDGAFENITMQKEHWANTLWYLWDIQLAKFRKDPRFKEVVRQAGLVEYWRSNTWADFCHPQGDDFYCE